MHKMPDKEFPRYVVSITAIQTDEAREKVISFLTEGALMQAPLTIAGLMDRLPLVVTRQADWQSAQSLKQQLEGFSAEIVVEPLTVPDTQDSLSQMLSAMQAAPVPQAGPTSMPATLPPGAQCSMHQAKPAQAICTRCGDFICEACNFGTEGRDYCPSCIPIIYRQWQQNRRGLPWDMRKQIGFFRGIAQTIRLLLSHPTEFFGKMRMTGGYSSPIWFAVSVSLVIALINSGTWWLVRPVLPGMDQMFPFNSESIWWAYNAGSLFLAATLGTLFMLGLYTGVYYMGAYILGVRTRLETVFRITAFVSGSIEIFSVIAYPLTQMFATDIYMLPVAGLGSLIFLAMHITYMYFGYKVVLQLPKGKAVLGAFSLIIFAILFMVVVAGLVMIIVLIGEFASPF